jgi:hypothetical protein
MGSHARRSLPVYDEKNQKRTSHPITRPECRRNTLPLRLTTANTTAKTPLTNGIREKAITIPRIFWAQAG